MSTMHSFDNFASFTDEKLALLAQAGSDGAFCSLLERYRVLVRKKSSSYYIVGADRDDIIQEGMIGLFKAVRDFEIDENVSFRTFADLCITRQIITAVKSAMRQKHAPLNFYVSLNKPVDSEGNDVTLSEVIAGRETENPEDILINKEKADIIGFKLSEQLSEFELSVLGLYLKGHSYISIGKAIGKDSKSVDNALQRIKKKIDKITAAMD